MHLKEALSEGDVLAYLDPGTESRKEDGSHAAGRLGMAPMLGQLSIRGTVTCTGWICLWSKRRGIPSTQ